MTLNELADQQSDLASLDRVNGKEPDKYDRQIAVLKDQLAATNEQKESLERMVELSRDSLDGLKRINAELDSEPAPVGIDLQARRDVLSNAHRAAYQELYRLEGAIRELDAINAETMAAYIPNTQPANTAEEK